MLSFGYSVEQIRTADNNPQKGEHHKKLTKCQYAKWLINVLVMVLAVFFFDFLFVLQDKCVISC